ncbi:cytochrome P450 family 722 subfamily A polypeptide 1 [Citrus sinensis]|nr:cytochrome P450 family 722 subfamily A polypeptide 1 [Citrus sinensis]
MDETLFLYGYIVFVIGIVIILIIMNTKKMLRGRSTVSIPPGSEGLPLIGETLQFMAAINSSQGFYQFIQVRHLKYGDCFRTNIFATTNVFFSSTGAAKIILNNEGENFTKRYIKSVGEIVGDNSVLCASTQRHKLIRSRLANLFSLSSLSIFTKQFDQLVLENLSDWEHKAATVVVLREALKVTFKAMCKILLSLESGKELEMLENDVTRVYDAMLAFPLKLPWTKFYRGVKARKRIMRTLEKMINIRRKGLETHEDFLQCLLAEDAVDKDRASLSSSSSETPKKLTDEEIQDNILTMIIAGQDTTASAITWMVKYLSENEEVLDKLKQAEHFPLMERTKKSLLTLEDLNRMPYASKVVKESLRMASIVAWYPRLVIHDCEIEGYVIKAGWSVNIDAKSIHLDSTVHSNPYKFNPSRFDGDESKPYGSIPFSMGGRACLGMHMAKAMMLVFLHRLITTYKWEMIDSDSSIDKWAMFARLKSGCPIHVKSTNIQDKAVAA